MSESRLESVDPILPVGADPHIRVTINMSYPSCQGFIAVDLYVSDDATQCRLYELLSKQSHLTVDQIGDLQFD